MSDINRAICGVFYIISAEEKEIESGSMLFLIVTDGSVRRKAEFESDSIKAKDIEGCFKRLEGYLDLKSETFIINTMNSIKYADIRVIDFFPYTEVPHKIIAKYLFSVADSLEGCIGNFCKAFAEPFRAFINQDYNCSITELELHKQNKCLFDSFKKLCFWKDLIYRSNVSQEDIVLAGAYAASFFSLFVQSFPAIDPEMSVLLLLQEIEYIGNRIGIEPMVLEKIKQATNTFCCESTEEIINMLGYDVFFGLE